jgi:hypothetical protein
MFRPLDASPPASRASSAPAFRGRRVRREKIQTAALELEIDEALEVIRAAGEVKPGSPEELLILVTMLLKKHSTSSAGSRPSFLIPGDED